MPTILQMPRFGHLWRHVIINTHCSWLHGDVRGFRSRNPAIRSSGDYKHPPPLEEYRRLREYLKQVAGPEVPVATHLRPVIGRAIVLYFRESGYKVLSVAVGKVHAHPIAELPQA